MANTQLDTIKAEDRKSVQIAADRKSSRIMVQKVTSDENTPINIGLVLLI